MSHRYKRRLSFARSLAASSVVGYIAGIGDRHPQNVLLDCATADVVHIDFGVAFEQVGVRPGNALALDRHSCVCLQGRLLPTPELIPFRLTRDLVAALGVGGLAGPFARSAEAAMDILRSHASALLVLVEVFLHDPLYDWALSPVRQLAVQGDAAAGGETAPAAAAVDWDGSVAQVSASVCAAARWG